MNTFKQRVEQWHLAIILSLFLCSLAMSQTSAAQSTPATCDSRFALWANGQGRDETLILSGSNTSITGGAHSNADLRISGSNNRITGPVEYATTFQDGGDNNSYPTPRQGSASQPPLGYAISDYRSGGSVAQAALNAGRYTVINGDFDVSEPTVLDGLYYVTGDAKLSASDIRGTFTIVAEGAIDVSGSNHQASPFANGLLLFSNKGDIGASVIKLAGSNSALRGVIYGPGGTVELSGSNNSIAGIVLGDALRLNGSDLQISFAGEYCQGAPTNPPGNNPPPRNERPRQPDKPAKITMGDDDVTERVEVVNSVTFVIVQITVKNTGGRAKDTLLVLEQDDDDGRFELVDVGFPTGTGYVREREGRRVGIGLGLYNVIGGNDSVTVSVRYRLRDGISDDDDGQMAFAVTGRLTYSDSKGAQTLQLPTIQVSVAVPVAAQPGARPADVARLSLDRIDVRFRSTWEQMGGIAIFGLPLTEARTDDDGATIQVFERARLEYRANVSDNVQMGRLAVELGYATPSTIRVDDLDDDERRWYVAQTGHVIAAPFRTFWTERGGILLFGLPIAPLSTDDNGRQMQCFERACMQLFPELDGTVNVVQLRLLGVELLTRDDDD